MKGGGVRLYVLRRIRRSLTEDGIENGYVQDSGDGRVFVVIRPAQDDFKDFTIDRSTARLLARRLNQYLEETK